MLRYIIQITEETRPLITLLNNGVEPAQEVNGDFFVAPAGVLGESVYNDLISKATLLEVYPECDPKAIFQITK